MTLIPIVVEQSSRGERAYDIIRGVPAAHLLPEGFRQHVVGPLAVFQPSHAGAVPDRALLGS